MVYKPKKTVNGHKKNDRSTRYRKRVKARRAAASRKPVRSNVKRYVAQQLDKIAPDNRYYFNVTEDPSDKIKPICQPVVANRIYPFGASFQKRFLEMEFRRMAPVIKSGMQTFPQLGPVETQWGHAGNTSDYHYDGSSGAQAYIKNRSGNFNHWRAVLGRGIHMKSASVYGTITVFPDKILYGHDIDVLRTAELTLHMFVLEDKAVTKTNFLDWYQTLIDKKESDGKWSSEALTRLLPDTWKGDTQHVPYCAGSAYVSNSGDASNKFVASETSTQSPYGPKSDGDDEFLIDWRQFYKHDDGATPSTNPANEVFHKVLPCTTSWDGSYDHSVLPINKSRFIVHEHKKWTIKPDSNGNVKQCFPWSYSFPEHYMTYEKQLLDMPFYYSNNATSTDVQGIQSSLLFPRKQPFIVFCWSKCSKEGPLHVPNSTTVGNPADVESSYTSGFININHDDVFHIDMNMKCHYENPLATKQVPTINKGKPLVHKRESSRPARPKDPLKRSPKEILRKPRGFKKKQRQSALPEFFKSKKPRTKRPSGNTGGPPSKKSKTYIGEDGNRYHVHEVPPPVVKAPPKSKAHNIFSDAWDAIKEHPWVAAEVIGAGAAIVLAPALAPVIADVAATMGASAARSFASGSILRAIGQRASMQGYTRLTQLASAGEGYFIEAGTELSELYESTHAELGFVRGLPTVPSAATAEYGAGYEGLIDRTADVARFNQQLQRNWTRNQLRDILVE